MYEVYLERAAERDLKRLPEEEFRAIVVAIEALAETPRPVSCRKLSVSKNDWRVRVGHRRIIYQIDDKAKIVYVMRVRHRREAYR